MKMKKQILTFLMALAMIVSLVGCGGDKSDKSAAGIYKLTKLKSDDIEMSAEEMADLFEMDVNFTLELKDDNSFTLDLDFLSEGDNTSGTWKLDGDSLILTAEGDSVPVTYDGKTIVMDVEGEILTFEKQ